MSTEKEIEQFRQDVKRAPRPSKLPSREELEAAAREQFKQLWSALYHLDEAAREGFEEPTVSVTYEMKGHPEARQVVGEIVATNIGTKPGRGPRTGTKFTIQGDTITLHDSKITGGEAVKEGFRFKSERQEDLILALIRKLRNFYNVPG